MDNLTAREARNLRASDTFVSRHIGPRPGDVETMLRTVGADSLESLIAETVPAAIRISEPLEPTLGMAERDLVTHLESLAAKNRVCRSFIGMGYHDTVTPPVIRRNILENPGWYTQYTPYQAEISQGRLEALLNFQTMVIDLTGLEVAGASLLDEGTAAAEAMTMCRRLVERKRKEATRFFVSEACHPQTIAVVRLRAEPLGLEVVVGDHESFTFDETVFGALVQYPDTNGDVVDYAPFCTRAHDAGASVVVATDLLALTLLRAPGEFGADVAVGSAQRFGVPLGFGGPHAAFMSAREEFRRIMPGRIVGVSKDAHDRPALRLALQTREQHIRRDKATSNICTAQALLAIMASMYAVYHGPDGLTRIARRIRALTVGLAESLAALGHRVHTKVYFDTFRITAAGSSREEVLARAHARGVNLRLHPDGSLGIALDQTTTPDDLRLLHAIFGGSEETSDVEARAQSANLEIGAPHARTSEFLTHPVFNRYHSETELLRYMKRLENKDLSLTSSMIPLGSCTMKLNGTAEMLAVTLPGFARLHPFAPASQAEGYLELFARLEHALADVTGFHAVSLQPNSGAQGEYTGLLVIRAYHHDRGDTGRNVCLIPSSAHGTNPASATMAGMEVVVVRCDDQGNIDVDDLREKIRAAGERLAAIMVTYPSTHGVFEESIREICDVVHAGGGLVYLDGANMNAMVGLSRPADIGADVCHLNLHKTFCIPHGGGGPGVGPIGVTEALAPYLPGHPVVKVGGTKAIGPVASAPWGSPSILTISYGYIRLMGSAGLRRATEMAILNANYVAKRLEPHYPVLYRGRNGRIAHECIIDVRPLKTSAGVEVDDIAKRLMDYGFHAPTMSFPVIGTLMVEPTESESLAELDRFCDAMIAIRREAGRIEAGEIPLEESALRHAPHTAEDVTAETWTRPYSRADAAYPAPWTREHKFWPPVSRIDNVYGDRNLVCACPPIEAYES